MRILKAALFILVTNFLVAAQAGPTDFKGSCPMIRPFSICSEFIGDAWDQVPQLACSSGAIASTSPCTQEGADSRCVILNRVGGFNTIQYYYDGGSSNNSVRLLGCDQLQGTFEVL